MQEIDAILIRLQSNDSLAVSDLLHELASFIYNFPKIRRKNSIVENGEFYEYAWSKLSDGNKLRSFDPSKGVFNIWFTKVLDNFLNTLISQKIKEANKLQTTDLEIESLEIDTPTPLEIISFDEEKQSITKVFSELNDTEKAVAICHTLFYRDIEPQELLFLSEFAKKELTVLSAKIEDLLTGELLEEEGRIRKESGKINALYNSLQKLEVKLSEYQLLFENDSSNKEIKELIDRLEFGIWKKRMKYIQLYQIHKRGKGLVLLRNRRIAELLNLKEGTVTSAVTRIRQKFKQ